MTNFKKGDLIKCVNTKGHRGLTKGKKYIVTSTDEEFVFFTDDDLWNGYPYEPDCFELSQIEAGDYFRDKKDGNIHLCTSATPTSIGDILYITHNTAFLDWQVEPVVWSGKFKEGDLVEIIHNGSRAKKSRGELYHTGDHAYIKKVYPCDVLLESLNGYFGASYIKEQYIKLVHRRNETIIKNEPSQERFSDFSKYDEAQEILDTLADIPTEAIEEYLELRKEEEDVKDRRTKAKLNVTSADKELKYIRREMKEIFK